MTGSDNCFFFGCSSDRRCPHSNQRWCKNFEIGNSNCTFCKSKIVVYRFDRINKLDRD